MGAEDGVMLAIWVLKTTQLFRDRPQKLRLLFADWWQDAIDEATLQRMFAKTL